MVRKLSKREIIAGVDESKWLKLAKEVILIESDALTAAAERLNCSFVKAVKIILQHPGKVVVSGVGKSGHIAQKMVATLCSTGTQAVFLHAVEAVHGDLGIYTPGDPTVLISKSGSTAELVRLIPILRQFNSPLISIVGNLQSPIAQQSDVALDGRVLKEADPLGVVPTSSATVALVLGDVLASVLMYARHFTEKDFARFHPGGQIGRNLGLMVKDVMHRGENVAWLKPNASLQEIVTEMTDKPLGGACVVDNDDRLMGLITEGDLRRVLLKFDNPKTLIATDIMTKSPVIITPNMSLKEALHLMEDRSSQISVLPVVNSSNHKCLGLLRLHDIHLTNLY